MAVNDTYAGSVAEATDASTGVDIRASFANAFLVIAAATPSLGAFEESDDDSSYSAIASEDLLFIDADGNNNEGLPSALADNSRAIIRYRGTKRYIRASGTNATVEVLKNFPARDPAPQSGVTA